MEPSGRVLLAVLCFSLAVCVLGRPSPQFSPAQVLGNSSWQGSNRTVGVLPFGTLEVPCRRSLRGGGGKGGRRGGGGGGGSSAVDSWKAAGVTIAFYVAVFLLFAGCNYYCKKKKKERNPPTDVSHQASEQVELPRQIENVDSREERR